MSIFNRHHQGHPFTPALIALAAAFLCLVPPAHAQEVLRLDENLQLQRQPTYDPASPEGKLQLARRSLAAEDYDHAQKLAEDWIKAYPNHAMMPDALLILGDSKAARNDFYVALFDYENLARNYPASPQFLIALEREYEIAKLFAAGWKRKLLGLSILPATEEAQELFIRIQERAPGSDVGERASIALADLFYNENEMESAAEAYDIFLLNYPRSSRREEGMLRLIQANLAQFKGPRFDSRGLLEAGQRLRTYQQEFPSQAQKINAQGLLLRIEESLARKTFYNAQWYEGQGKKPSAAYIYQRVIKDYPRSAAAQDSVKRLAAIGWPLPPMDQSPATQPTPAGTTPLSSPRSEARP